MTALGIILGSATLIALCWLAAQAIARLRDHPNDITWPVDDDYPARLKNDPPRDYPKRFHNPKGAA